MSTYADKKAGKLTGRFVAEIEHGGRRLKARFPSLAAAVAAETSWRATIAAGGWPGRPEAPQRRPEAVRPATLSELIDAARPHLWTQAKVASQNWSSLLEAVTLMGDLPLASLSTESVDAYIVELEARVAPATINRKLSALSAVLAWGHARGYLAQLPVIEWRDEDEGRIRWLTPAEERAVLALLDHETADFVRVLVDTGLRPSELLRRPLVDDGAIHLAPDQTKTGKARLVPLTPRAAAILAKRTSWSPYWALRRAWNKARAELGLGADPWFTLYVCRHTFATRLVKRRVNIRVIQRLMGHASITTTERYAQVDDDTLREAVAELAGFAAGRPELVAA